MSPVRDRLRRLRALMTEVGVDAYLVPSTDPHQSEYVPAFWQRRQYLSDFTGSAGDVLVTRDTAGLWTDGRYFLQAAQQLKGSGIRLFKQGNPHVPTLLEWLGRHLGRGEAVGVDPTLVSRGQVEGLRRALDGTGAQVKFVEQNLVDRIWEERPPPPGGPIEVLPAPFAGESAARKLDRLRKAMAERRADAHVLTTLDAIAWLFNIRSSDVDFNPVVIAYALVTAERALLFVEPDRVGPGVRRALAARVGIQPYDQLGSALARLGKSRARVWVDGRTASAWVLGRLQRCVLIDEPTPVARMKAKKNPAEIAGARDAQLRDGVAMVRFFAWLDRVVARGKVTELSAAARLRKLRSEGAHFRGESFETIVAYGAHGAIIHYGATDESDVPLCAEGILLVDSGGQYLDGTTDITRTVLLGAEATAEQRDRFTRVLKGHIAVARARFPAGTAGRQIDTMARMALWDVGLNYNHGTGHGVGAYLSVHEGPQSIHPTRCQGVPLEPGNILSNEPGFYEEGAYGIRLENLVLVVEDLELSRRDETWLRFETLTLCPFDTRLVERSLLTADERQWIDAYHARVRQALTPQLRGADARWLDRATRPI